MILICLLVRVLFGSSLSTPLPICGNGKDDEMNGELARKNHTRIWN